MAKRRKPFPTPDHEGRIVAKKGLKRTDQNIKKAAKSSRDKPKK